jgi:hypothetical protein
MESSDILPAFLEEGNQEVDRHVDVLSQLFFSHFNSSDGGTHAENLLQLEFDGSFDFLNFILDFFVFTDRNGEFANFIQCVSEQFGNLLHQRFRSDQNIEWLGPLLDELLVLVEFLETIDIEVTNVAFFGLVAMDSGTDKTDLFKVRIFIDNIQISLGMACWGV